MTTLAIPNEYGYVLLVNFVGTFILFMWLGARVGQARKKFDVPYPTMYHPTKNDFNNVQRGHQNALETLPFYLAAALIAGLQYPLFTAFSGLCYLYGRVAFALNYAKGGADARYKGFASVMYVGIMGNTLLVLWMGLQMALGF